jgi:transcriptional regulator with XRE-family HTH domain
VEDEEGGPAEEELFDQPGDQLRSRRLSQEISQRHLAEVSGVTQSVISRLERGAGASVPTWKRLFGALGYGIVLKPEKYTEESGALLEDQKRARGDRVEAGRERRWG